jgi:hypothetical protein
MSLGADQTVNGKEEPVAVRVPDLLASGPACRSQTTITDGLFSCGADKPAADLQPLQGQVVIAV